MKEAIVTLILGIVCVCLGISHRKGNLSALHSYHRSHVSEEDKPAFGKKVGLGTIVCGGAFIVRGGCAALALLTEQQVFTTVGTVILIAGLVVGLGIALYAMMKYNKGIIRFQ